MSKEKTPEQQAEERYPAPPFPWGSATKFTGRDMQEARQEAHARCLKDYTIPAEQRVKELEAENASLREAAQEAADALAVSRNELYEAVKCMVDRGFTDDETDGYKDAMASVEQSHTALAKLAENSVTPHDR